VVYNIRQEGKPPAKQASGKVKEMNKERLIELMNNLSEDEIAELLRKCEAREKEKKEQDALRYARTLAYNLGVKMPEVVTEFRFEAYGVIGLAKRNKEGAFVLVEAEPASR
jgi:predicted type IV restriction endonuclease